MTGWPIQTIDFKNRLANSDKDVGVMLQQQSSRARMWWINSLITEDTRQKSCPHDRNYIVQALLSSDKPNEHNEWETPFLARKKYKVFWPLWWISPDNEQSSKGLKGRTCNALERKSTNAKVNICFSFLWLMFNVWQILYTDHIGKKNHLVSTVLMLLDTSYIEIRKWSNLLIKSIMFVPFTYNLWFDFMMTAYLWESYGNLRADNTSPCQCKKILYYVHLDQFYRRVIFCIANWVCDIFHIFVSHLNRHKTCALL